MPALGEDDSRDCGDNEDDAGGGAEGKCLGEGQDADDYCGEGFEGSEDGAEGRTDALDGRHEGDVGDCGAEQGDTENIGSEEAVGQGHPADSAEEHADDSETDSAEAHHADSQGKGGHLPDTGLAHTDDVGTIGNDGKSRPQNTGGDIAPLKPYVASGQTTCPYQGEDDGTNLAP